MDEHNIDLYVILVESTESFDTSITYLFVYLLNSFFLLVAALHWEVMPPEPVNH